MRLTDAENPALALESRYRVFQTLTHTLSLDAAQWRILDQAHRKRNLAEYEGDLDVDEALVAAIVRVVQVMAERVAALGPVPRQSFPPERPSRKALPRRARKSG